MSEVWTELTQSPYYSPYFNSGGGGGGGGGGGKIKVRNLKSFVLLSFFNIY